MMNIRRYKPEDEQMVLETMTKAFAGDPLYISFVLDEGKRRAFLKKFMKFRLRFGMKKGDVWVTDDCKGVAVWIRPNETMTPADLIRFGGLSAMLFRCDSAGRKRLMAFNNFSDAERDRCIAQPFWHLSPICVAPDCQGQGYGTQLMQHGLTEVRASGIPCYLETQSEKNQRFYQNAGFELSSEAEVPEMGLTSYGMIFWG